MISPDLGLDQSLLVQLMSNVVYLHNVSFLKYFWLHSINTRTDLSHVLCGTKYAGLSHHTKDSNREVDLLSCANSQPNKQKNSTSCTVSDCLKRLLL